MLELAMMGACMVNPVIGNSLISVRGVWLMVPMETTHTWLFPVARREVICHGLGPSTMHSTAFSALGSYIFLECLDRASGTWGG